MIAVAFVGLVGSGLGGRNCKKESLARISHWVDKKGENDLGSSAAWEAATVGKSFSPA
jgi:hypothetical protein